MHVSYKAALAFIAQGVQNEIIMRHILLFPCLFINPFGRMYLLRKYWVKFDTDTERHQMNLIFKLFNVPPVLLKDKINSYPFYKNR